MLALWIAMLVCVLAGIWLYAGRSDQADRASQAASGGNPAADTAKAQELGPFLAIGAAQHIGDREEQQDAYGFCAVASRQQEHAEAEVHTGGGVLAVLADGMGGFAMGKEAGLLAVEKMLSGYEHPNANQLCPQALEAAVHQAAEAVWELSRVHQLEWHVGTTLVAALVEGHELYYISAGDSRIYLLRDGELHRLTHDHIYANRLFERVQAGELALEEALSHPERDLLTSYLGLPELVEYNANQEPLRLQPGDRVLLCSDGLYGELSEPLLGQSAGLDAQQIADYLVRHVIGLGRKHQDNASVVVIAFD